MTCVGYVFHTVTAKPLFSCCDIFSALNVLDRYKICLRVHGLGTRFLVLLLMLVLCLNAIDVRFIVKYRGIILHERRSSQKITLVTYFLLPSVRPFQCALTVAVCVAMSPLGVLFRPLAACLGNRWLARQAPAAARRRGRPSR